MFCLQVKYTALFSLKLKQWSIPSGFIDKEGNVNLPVHDKQGQKLQVYVQY